MERSKYLARFLRLLPFSLGDKRAEWSCDYSGSSLLQTAREGGKNGRWPSFAALEQPSIFPVRA